MASNPGKYPFTGPNYAQYGEVEGYIYWPWDDSYYIDPAAVEEYNNQNGLSNGPEDPSTWDQIKVPLYTSGATAATGTGIKLAYDAWTADPTAANTVNTGVQGANTANAGLQTTNSTAQGVNAGAQGANAGVQATSTGTQGASSGFGSAGGSAAGGDYGAAAGANAGYNASTAGTSATAGNTFGVLGGTGATLGLAGQAYYYGTEGYDAYDKLTNSSAADDGAGAVKAGLLATGPFLGWAAPLVDYAGIKTGKHKDQYQRDVYRSNMKNLGFVDDKYRYQMSDGSYYDLGVENLQGAFSDPDGKGEVIEGAVPNDRSYNIDWNNVDPNIVGALNPIAYFFSGGNTGDRMGNLVGQFYNMVTSSNNPQAEIQKLYDDLEKLGYGRDDLADAMRYFAGKDDRKEGEKIDQATIDAFISGIDVNTRNQLDPNFVKSPSASAPEAPDPQENVQIQAPDPRSNQVSYDPRSPGTAFDNKPRAGSSSAGGNTFIPSHVQGVNQGRPVAGGGSPQMGLLGVGNQEDARRRNAGRPSYSNRGLLGIRRSGG